MAAVAALLSLCLGAPTCTSIVLMTGMQCQAGYYLISEYDANRCSSTICNMLKAKQTDYEWGMIHIDSTDQFFKGWGYIPGCGTSYWDGLGTLGQSLCAAGVPSPATPAPVPSVCSKVVISPELQCKPGYRLISEYEATTCQKTLCHLLSERDYTWADMLIDSENQVFFVEDHSTCGLRYRQGEVDYSLCVPSFAPTPAPASVPDARLSVGAIVAIVVGCVSAVAGLGGVLLLCRAEASSQKQQQQHFQHQQQQFQQQQLQQLQGGDPSCDYALVAR